jgi:hypothetical protein
MTTKEVDAYRSAFIHKWRVKRVQLRTSPKSAANQLFGFARLSLEQWRSARTTNVFEQLHEEFN